MRKSAPYRPAQATAQFDAARLAIRRYLHTSPGSALPPHFMKDSGFVIETLYDRLKYGQSASRIIDAPYSRAGKDAYDPVALAQLLAHIADETGVVRHDIDPVHGLTMMRQALRCLIEPAGTGPSFSIAGYNFLYAGRLWQSVENVRNDFIAHLQSLLPAQTPEVVRWFGGELLAEYEPTLDRNDLDTGCIYGSLVWANLVAGIDTATALAIIPATRGYAELIELGRTLFSAAGLREDIGAEFLLPQLHAALRFADANHDIDLSDSEPSGLESLSVTAFESYNAARIKSETPLADARKALAQAAPERAVIAKNILLDLGLDPAALGHARPISRTAFDPCIGDRPLQQFYMDGCTIGLHQALARAGRLGELPDLTAAYEKTFESWFRKLTPAMTTLIAAAFNRLDADDYLFWHNTPAQLLQPTIIISEKAPLVRAGFGGMGTGADQFFLRNTRLHGKKTLLFASDNDDARRLFIVTFVDLQTPVVRCVKVNNDALGTANYIDRHREIFFSPDTLARIPAQAHAVTCNMEQLAAFDETPVNTHQRARQIASALNGFMRDAQYTQGYQRTGVETGLADVRAFFLGLIPFYDCADAIADGRQEDAMLPCALDTLGAVPVFSQAAKSGSLMLRLAKKLPAELTRELGGIAAEGISRNTIRAIGAFFHASQTSQAFLMPAKKAASALGKSLLQFVDPGFEMLYRLPQTTDALISVLKNNRHTQAIAALLQRRKTQAAHYDPQRQGWYLQHPIASPTQSGGLAAHGPASDLAMPAEASAGGPITACAIAPTDDQCMRLARLNPSTGKLFGPYLAPLPDASDMLRTVYKLDGVYDSAPFMDETGSGFAFTLPPGAEVRHLPHLSRQYDDLEIFDIDGRQYGVETARDVPQLILLNKILRERGKSSLCRPDRAKPLSAPRGYRARACALSLTDLRRGRDATAIDRYEVAFDQGKKNVFQYNRGTRKNAISAEAMTVSRMASPQTADATHSGFILTPDGAYKIVVNNRNRSLRDMSNFDVDHYQIDLPVEFEVTTGHVVSYDGAAGNNMQAVAFNVNNGPHICRYRAIFGTYGGTPEQPRSGMIRVGEHSYYRFDLPLRAGRMEPVTLQIATSADIADYREYQDLRLGEWKDIKKQNFDPRISESDAGKLIRIFKKYDLEQYDMLVEKLNASPIEKREGVIDALTDYVKHPDGNPALAPHREIKTAVDRLLQHQLSDPERVTQFRRGLVSSFNQKNRAIRQQIRPLSMEPDDLDNTLHDFAALYPDLQPMRNKYSAMMARAAKPGVAELYQLIAGQFTAVFQNKNVAYAQVRTHAGPGPKIKYYFATSGSSHTKSGIRKTRTEVPTIKVDAGHIDALKAYESHLSSRSDALRYEAGQLLPNLPDANEAGLPHHRTYDSERLILTEVMIDHPDPDSLSSVRLVSRYNVCHSCAVSWTIFADYYKNTPMEFLHLSPGSKYRSDSTRQIP